MTGYKNHRHKINSTKLLANIFDKEANNIDNTRKKKN